MPRQINVGKLAQFFGAISPKLYILMEKEFKLRVGEFIVSYWTKFDKHCRVGGTIT